MKKNVPEPIVIAGEVIGLLGIIGIIIFAVLIAAH
jgi:hypothetical protein